MIVYPNAKINLGLNIVSKREDGFHNLQTVFYPIQLCDMLEFIESPNMEFTNSGINIDCHPEDNLVVKAYRMLQKQYNLPNAKIHLHKVIPFGAGLGGGSSDAAFMLKAINDHFKLGLSEEELIENAAKLGSDCAFFIKNRPCFATGRGEILEDIELDIKNKYWVLVKPNTKVSTPAAFRHISPKTPSHNLKDTIKLNVSEWNERLFNDFEKSVFPQFPEIEAVKNQLNELGATYTAMSGSGASVFGIFDTQPTIDQLFPNDYFVWEGKVD